MEEQNRQEQASLQLERYAEKFVPELNQKSMELAEKNRNKFHTEVSGMDFPMSHRQPHVEDLLIMKGTISKQRISKQKADQED